jgi:hypothetical protein
MKYFSSAVVGNEYILLFFFQWLDKPLGGLGPLIFRGFTITHFLDIPH